MRSDSSSLVRSSAASQSLTHSGSLPIMYLQYFRCTSSNLRASSSQPPFDFTSLYMASSPPSIGSYSFAFFLSAKSAVPSSSSVQSPSMEWATDMTM